MDRPRWQRRPVGSTWGDFGRDDQIGRLNLLTPERVLGAIREVRVGLGFCLSLPLDLPGGSVANPRRLPPVLFAASEAGEPVYNRPTRRADGSASTTCVSDDGVVLYTQYSTQWDSLAHVGAAFDANDDGEAELVYYNGWRAGEDIAVPIAETDAESSPRFAGARARALGVETMAQTCVQGRGVLVDLHSRYGREPHRVTYDDLMEIMAADRVVVEPGDILCLWTGYDRLVLDLAGRPTREALHHSCSALDGSDERLLQWITDSQVAAIVSDNRAVEALPVRSTGSDGHTHPLHVHCLFKLGVPLGELWWLAELADWLHTNRRSRFLLTAPPLRLPGAVGSPVTPVATV